MATDKQPALVGIPAVSKWYKYDWQFAKDIGQIPLIKETTLIVAIAPFLSFLWGSAGVPKLGDIPTRLFWMAAVAFIGARVIFYCGCPRFIRDYRDFGDYVSRQNSHRWIVWEFYHNLRSLDGWKTIVREIEPKGLTLNFSAISKTIQAQLGEDFRADAKNATKVFKPINIDRDIYLPIHWEGQRIVLAMLEKDPELGSKEKELFWILYSQAAKERIVARVAYWSLVALAIVLVFVVLLMKTYCMIQVLNT